MTFARVVPLATALVLVLSAAAWAGPPSDQLRARVDAAIALLEDPALRAGARTPERRAALQRIAADIFDFPEITRRAVGRHWQEMAPSEREELVRLFTALLERAYVGKIEQYAGERVVYLGDAVEGGRATVRTRLVTKQGTEIPVDYRMYARGDRWLAYDVSIEGVSLVANYRAQFSKIIRSGSTQALVARLREKRE